MFCYTGVIKKTKKRDIEFWHQCWRPVRRPDESCRYFCFLGSISTSTQSVIGFKILHCGFERFPPTLVTGRSSESKMSDNQSLCLTNGHWKMVATFGQQAVVELEDEKRRCFIRLSQGASFRAFITRTLSLRSCTDHHCLCTKCSDSRRDQPGLDLSPTWVWTDSKIWVWLGSTLVSPPCIGPRPVQTEPET